MGEEIKDIKSLKSQPGQNDERFSNVKGKYFIKLRVPKIRTEQNGKIKR